MEERTIVYESTCRRLFEEDAFIQEFTACITSVEISEKKELKLMLDQTAFFPEGGGQAADTGTLECAGHLFQVTDTHEKKGSIYHTVAVSDMPQEEALEILKAGQSIKGKINWQDRFDRMQNHSGEHIVSGLVHQKFGYENVGFHMGAEFTTIDFSGPLTMADLEIIEQEANAYIWKDLPTKITVYSEEEIKAVSYRSKKELIGNVRIVEFPEADACACCGTHVKSTGQIGLIKLFSCVSFRGGVRVEMLCGRRALEYLSKVRSQNQEISVALSARPLETAAAVNRVKEQLQTASFQLTGLREKEIAQKAESLAGKGNLCLFETAYTPELVRKLCTSVMEKGSGICMVFSGNDQEGYKYAIGQTGGDLREMVKDLNTKLQGRGGGKPFFAQGSIQASRERIEEWAKCAAEKMEIR